MLSDVLIYVVLFFLCADNVDMCFEWWGLIWRRCPNTWNNKVATYQYGGKLLSISTLSLSPPLPPLQTNPSHDS